MWKRAIESNRTTLAFLEEFKDRQVPKLEEDKMEVETAIDLGEDTVKGYAMLSFRNILLFDRRGEQLKNKTLTETGRHHSENIPPFQ